MNRYGFGFKCIDNVAGKSLARNMGLFGKKKTFPPSSDETENVEKCVILPEAATPCRLPLEFPPQCLCGLWVRVSQVFSGVRTAVWQQQPATWSVY
jgi:hypothetical protein